jgi:hypothetical protein
MTTKATSWAAQIAVAILVLATGTASASSGLLSANSPRGKNSLEGSFHRAWASVSAEPHRGWGEVCAGRAAGSVVAPVRVTGQIGYGSSDLSRAAQAYRGTAGVTGGRNVAIFEYRAADGSLQTIARASERGVGHAERIIARELETMGVQPSQVTRIYSELQPCNVPGGYCDPFIRRTFPQAEVSWSFEYGATAESRAAGVEALRRAAGNLGR